MSLQKFEATPSLSNGQVVWTLCYTNPQPDQCGNSNATYPDVSVAQNNGNQPFQFKIVNDNTGRDIQFAATNPVWVQANSKPTGPGVNTQITTVGGGGSKILTFVDLNTLPDSSNPAPVVLKYQLNFTDGKGNPVTSIDPDITNGGKTIYSFNNTAAVAVAVAGAVALVLILLWFRSRAARNAAREG